MAGDRPRCAARRGWRGGPNDSAFRGDPLRPCDEIVDGLGRSEENCDGPDGPDNREIGDVDRVAKRIQSVMAGANEAWWHRTWRAPTPFHINDYRPGQCFTLHRDNAAFAADWALSAIVVLNDPSEWEGGEFQILERHDLRSVPVSKGTVIVFESTLPHQCTEVTAGRRVSLAAFWISHLVEVRIPLDGALRTS